MKNGDKALKATFLVPLRDNDGRVLSSEIALLNADLRARFGGYTHYGAPTSGTWTGEDGRVVRDSCFCYWVLLETEACVGALKAILLEFKKQTLQQEVYLEVTRDVEVAFV